MAHKYWHRRSMLQLYGTYVCDTGPYKLYYKTHILDMLLKVRGVSRAKGVKGR